MLQSEVVVASCGVVLSVSECCLGGLWGLFAEKLHVWYPPPRSPQGQLPAGASAPWQEGYLSVGPCQGCVVSAFSPSERRGGWYIKYHREIANSKVTSTKRQDGEAHGHFFTAKKFLSLEKAILPTFPTSFSEGKSPGGSHGCGEQCPSPFLLPPFEIRVSIKLTPGPLI